jgi:hypothetical protein
MAVTSTPYINLHLQLLKSLQQCYIPIRTAQHGGEYWFQPGCHVDLGAQP